MSSIERVLEICASTRVLERRRAAALARGGALGLELVSLRGLAERCAAESEPSIRGLLDDGAVSRLVAGAAESLPRLAALLRGQPRLIRALAATVRDLRDAGVRPQSLEASFGDLRALYSEVEQRLERLALDGFVDRIGLFRAAARGAEAYLRRREIARVAVHGATELVGSAGDLVAALARALPAERFRFFQPDWASPFAERLRAEWPWQFRPEPVEIIDQPALARDGGAADEALVVRAYASPRDEVEALAVELLRLLEAGVSPAEILVVARTLDPYAPWLQAILGPEGYGIPFETPSVRTRALLPPWRLRLALVRALGSNLERDAVLRTLGEQPDLERVRALADFAAREGAVVRGEAEWRAALALVTERDAAPELRARLEGLFAARNRFAAAASFSDSLVVIAAAERALGGNGDWSELAAALAALDRVDQLDSKRERPAPEELVTEFERLITAPRTPLAEADGRAAVAVLDAAQARALPCRHLFVLGLVHGRWPREPADDPFLPNSARLALRQRLRRPVPTAAGSLDEERFLLGLLLSQASERVWLSLPRADDEGRALPPSPFLRDLPFLARGADVLPRTRDEGAPPRAEFARAAELLEAARELSPAALRLAERLGATAPALLEAGRAYVSRTDALTDESLAFDGEVGAAALRLPEFASPSFVESLGRCALRGFFRGVLRVDELRDPELDVLEANDRGALVHRALHALYEELYAEGLLQPGTASESALARARERLPAVVASQLAALGGARAERHPLFGEVTAETLRRALDDFAARDLAENLPQGFTELEFEHAFRARVAGFELEGRVDRLGRRSDGRLEVGDYKSSADLARYVGAKEIARGRALQLPLYALGIANARATNEVVAVALAVPVRPERDRDEQRFAARRVTHALAQEQAERPLTELRALLASGRFPLRINDDECRHCPYIIACRREHVPTRARLDAAPELAGYRALDDES